MRQSHLLSRGYQIFSLVPANWDLTRIRETKLSMISDLNLNRVEDTAGPLKGFVLIKI